MRLDQTVTGEGEARLTGGAVADWSIQFVTHTRAGPDSGGRTAAFGHSGGGEQFELLDQIPNGAFGPGVSLP